MVDRKGKTAARRWLVALALGIFALGLSAAGLALSPGVYAANVTVDMADFNYAPNQLTVPAGSRVIWLNRGGMVHNVSAVDGSWDSGAVEPGAYFERVFTRPGVYRFYSRFYAGPDTGGMNGQITVLAQTTATPPPYVPDPNAIQVPEGYRVEVAATGLTLPSALAVGPDGLVYVAEAGAEGLPPSIQRINADGSLTRVAPADGFAFEINLLGIAFSPTGVLYASHNGKISRVNADGSLDDIVTDLPSKGFHGNEHMQFGPDGKLYFSQGSVTNAGVLGPNPEGGPPPAPPVREIPCRTITLVGQNFTDTNGVVTGAYQPLGTPSTPGQVIQGMVPCGGAILRVDANGSNMSVAGWGFRNPYGMRFAPAGHPLAGNLFVTNNSMDPAPPRPVGGALDDLSMIENPSSVTTQTAPWFGWPDFANGRPVNTAPFSPTAAFLWTEHPPVEPGVTDFAAGQVPGGLDFSTTATFGFVDDLFIANWGFGRGANGNPPSVTRLTIPGDPTGGIPPSTALFAVSKEPDRIDAPGHGGLNHPLDVKFSPDGATMYIADFANFSQVPGSGTVWRVTRIQPTATPTLTPTVTSTASATAIPPTATSTPTATSVPPTATATAVPPTATTAATVTNTAVPATATNTPVPATATTTTTAVPATATNTPVPPTATTTTTAVPATATNTSVPPTATVTNTAVPATATNTSVPPTATTTTTAVPATATNTPIPPTPTAPVRPTSTPVPCGDGNLCNGIVVVRAYIDFGCDGFFNRGTDWPLAGTSVILRLPDGSTRLSIVDENGNAIFSSIGLVPGQSVEVIADADPPPPTWVQLFGYSLAACDRSPTTRTISRSQFSLFGQTYVDFQYTLVQ